MPAWASRAMLLAACLPWHAAVEATLPPYTISMSPPRTIYLVVPEGPRGLGSPRDFRNHGGISNSRLPAPGEEEITREWQRLRNIRVHMGESSEELADFLNHLDTVIFNFQESEEVARTIGWGWIDPRQIRVERRVWIYEIAAAPTMLLHYRQQDGAERLDVLNVGGIPWSQVIRFSQLDLSHPGVVGPLQTLTRNDPRYPAWINSVQLSWMRNAEYDGRWGLYGGTVGIPHDTFDHPEGTTRVERAREIMNLVTSSHMIPDPERRQTLRELLDWDADREPDRTFPLLRHAQPLGLGAWTLPLVDWSLVQIPEDVRLALASGLANAIQCRAALQPFRNFFLGGPKGKREEPQRDADADACEQLSVLVKEAIKIPEPCRRINKIEITMSLSDGFMAGTWDKVGGTLEGPAGTAEFFFAESPDAGAHGKMVVDMQKYFGQDEINITAIDKMTLNAQGEFWKLSSLRNDAFTIRDISIRAQCSDPAYTAFNNRYIGLNKDLKHTSDKTFLGDFKKSTVGVLEIRPGDWSFTTPCHVRQLRYDFRVSSGFGSGTWDSIYFTLGHSERQIALGKSVEAGFSSNGVVNLRRVFGTDSVDIRDLDKIAIGDTVGTSVLSHVLDGDAWSFQGITLTATCAENQRRLKLTKFESVNSVVQNQDDKPVWAGDVSPEDWIEVA
ncbi:uncharacterized protein MAM_07730 [Metarhizium album ARSEF 1941]|uniref:Uncharacterized protein n=1 Tax=Metarhizium album (strain ARSEF 1941) TaxID=1081103 RepID=A0A0B2WL46_METAS|nr:uncharacterized protein MAM_07730 [Metarhizium album ARSEF 1941]KHN94414.1 hypothetical protein MAM_07730 [Metarhizium album ARSEF 1941]